MKVQHLAKMEHSRKPLLIVIDSYGDLHCCGGVGLGDIVSLRCDWERKRRERKGRGKKGNMERY